MEETGWLGAVELKQQLDEAESKLTQALDELTDLRKVKRRAQTVAMKWPQLRDLPVETWPTDLVAAFNDHVSYMSQSIQGRDSELPPPMATPVADKEYLSEVVLELWEIAKNEADPHEAVQKMRGILDIAVQTELEDDSPTDISMIPKLVIPAGHQWLDPEVHGPAPVSKSVDIRRLRAEDDGPEYPDGPTADGFPGGDERMGVAPQVVVGAPKLPKTPNWRELEPIPTIDRLRGVIRSDDPMDAPRDRNGVRLRRSYVEEKAYRQLSRDIGKLNAMGVYELDRLGKFLPWEPPADEPNLVIPERSSDGDKGVVQLTPDLCGCGGTCLWCKQSATRKDPDALAARLARIESILGLDTAF